MPKVLYRFPTGEGLVHLLSPSLFNNIPFTEANTTQGLDLNRRESRASDIGIEATMRYAKEHDTVANADVPRLEIKAIHHSTSSSLNGFSSVAPSLTSIAHHLVQLRFHQLVCDFDETITEHDTTCSFDILRRQIYTNDINDDNNSINNSRHKNISGGLLTTRETPPEPRLTWDEILNAYLDDLAKVQVGDLDHLHCDRKKVVKDDSISTNNGSSNDTRSHQQEQTQEASMPTASEQGHTLPSCDNNGYGNDILALTDPCLLPWFKTQVRRRSAEVASLRRVFESGNLVGLTSAQIREYGRWQVRLRQGLVDLLRKFYDQQRQEQEQGQGQLQEQQQQRQQQKQQGHLWILSVNWSQDLIRGALDQIFEHPHITDRVVPASRLISSNLAFGPNSLEQQREEKEQQHRRHDHVTSSQSSSITTGQVHAQCLTGCDKLQAFRTMQTEHAAQQDFMPTGTKWAYLGDSLTDLGCLVEADLGIIIGTSSSLLSECERAGIQVIDLQIIDDKD